MNIVRRGARFLKKQLGYRRERRTREGYNLNVGSGHQTIDGFISLDLDSDWYRAKGRKFIEYNMMEDALPCADESVDNIYCSHVVEHLPDATAARFISEAHRVLKPSGTLRLACPDGEFLWEVSSFPNGYWQWRDEWFANPVYSRDPAVHASRADYFVRELATPSCTHYTHRRREIAYGDDIFEADYGETIARLHEGLDFDPQFPGDHINAWDFAKMREFGRAAGFSKIIRSKRGGSVSAIMQHPDFDRTCPNMSLYVDMVKG